MPGWAEKQGCTRACLILAGKNHINQEIYEMKKPMTWNFRKVGEGFFRYLPNEGEKMFQGYTAYMIILHVSFQAGRIFKELVGFCSHPKARLS